MIDSDGDKEQVAYRLSRFLPKGIARVSGVKPGKSTRSASPEGGPDKTLRMLSKFPRHLHLTDVLRPAPAHSAVSPSGDRTSPSSHKVKLDLDPDSAEQVYRRLARRLIDNWTGAISLFCTIKEISSVVSFHPEDLLCSIYRIR